MAKNKRMESKGSIAYSIKYPIIVIIVVCAITIVFSHFIIRNNIEVLGVDAVLRNTAEARQYIRLLTILLAQCILLMGVVPLAMILGGNSGARKHRRKQLTYKATQGIEYLRETFTDLNPATASLLMDLQIDHKKDINATLLRMYHKGSVNIGGDEITLLDRDLCTESCEIELFDILKNGKITQHAMWQWGENRKNEAVQKGLLIHKKSRGIKGCCIGCCVSCVFVVILFAILTIAPGVMAFTGHGLITSERTVASLENIYHRLEAIQGTFDSLDATVYLLVQTFTEEGGFTAEMLQELNQYLLRLIRGLMLVIVILFVPPYLFIRSLSYQTSPDGLSRTKEGHRRTEEVAALKRFIRDFGNFSGSEKEHVVLWEDFLVFAIVLEENSSIIKDISRISKNGIKDMEFVSVVDNQYEEAGMPSHV